MKKLVAIFLLLFICESHFVFAQTERKIYTWEIAKIANPDTIVAITFEKDKLDSLPAELNKFTSLKELYLGKNKLSTLPDYISDFKNLEILDLSRNNFSEFPTQVYNLKELKKLILNRNDFTTLTYRLGNLTKLEYLDLWATPVSAFPEEITNLKNLKLIDVRGVLHGPQYQKKWKEKLSWVKIEFDAPCNCLE